MFKYDNPKSIASDLKRKVHHNKLNDSDTKSNILIPKTAKNPVNSQLVKVLWYYGHIKITSFFANIYVHSREQLFFEKQRLSKCADPCQDER